jgi:hypothetical protein
LRILESAEKQAEHEHGSNGWRNFSVGDDDVQRRGRVRGFDIARHGLADEKPT